MELVELAGDDVVVEPQHRAGRGGGLAQHQRAGGFEHQAAEQVGDQGLAVGVHLHDLVGGTDHQVGQGLAVGHGPGGEVAEALHHRAAMEGVHLGQHLFHGVAVGQQRIAGLPLGLGPGAAVFLFEGVEQGDQRQLDADEDVGGVGADFWAVIHGGLDALRPGVPGDVFQAHLGLALGVAGVGLPLVAAVDEDLGAVVAVGRVTHLAAAGLDALAQCGAAFDEVLEAVGRDFVEVLTNF